VKHGGEVVKFEGPGRPEKRGGGLHSLSPIASRDARLRSRDRRGPRGGGGHPVPDHPGPPEAKQSGDRCAGGPAEEPG
jgi:hypothetical protein